MLHSNISRIASSPNYYFTCRSSVQVHYSFIVHLVLVLNVYLWRALVVSLQVTLLFVEHWWIIYHAVNISFIAKFKIVVWDFFHIQSFTIFEKANSWIKKLIWKRIGMGLISLKIVQSQLRRRLLKAASELALHYFLCRINATAAIKWLTALSFVVSVCITWEDGKHHISHARLIGWFRHVSRGLMQSKSCNAFRRRALPGAILEKDFFT